MIQRALSSSGIHRRLALVAGCLFFLVSACAPSAPSFQRPATNQQPGDPAGLKPAGLAPTVAAATPPLLAEAGSAPTIAATPTDRPAPTSTPVQPTPDAATPAPAVDTVSFAPEAPTRLLIPSIGVDAPVISVGWSVVEQGGQQLTQWDVPDWAAAGWLETSARVGEPGNTVLVGHQNVAGEVFQALEHLKQGDTIQILAGNQTRGYTVSIIEIVPEKNQSIEVRTANAQWIAPTADERLTLVTCWPSNNNTHRLIVVAVPPGAPPASPPTSTK